MPGLLLLSASAFLCKLFTLHSLFSVSATISPHQIQACGRHVFLSWPVQSPLALLGLVRQELPTPRPQSRHCSGFLLPSPLLHFIVHLLLLRLHPAAALRHGQVHVQPQRYCNSHGGARTRPSDNQRVADIPTRRRRQQQQLAGGVLHMHQHVPRRRTGEGAAAVPPRLSLAVRGQVAHDSLQLSPLPNRYSPRRLVCRRRINGVNEMDNQLTT